METNSIEEIGLERELESIRELAALEARSLIAEQLALDYFG